MADLSDVLNALVSLIDSVVYPSGDLNPSAIVVGSTHTPVRIYPGWPVASKLDADLSAGVANVSVFPAPGMERNVSRYQRRWRVIGRPAPTLTASIDSTGTIVTYGGTVSVPQNVAIIANDIAVAYQVQSTDTLASIAATMAAKLTTAGVAASATGPAVSIPSAHSLEARIGVVGTAQLEAKRQVRLFDITIWAPTPAIRTALAKAIDPALAMTNFLTLADAGTGRLLYQRTAIDDSPQKENLWRLDLFYTVEYPTTIDQDAAEAIVVTTEMQGAASPPSTFTETMPPPEIFNA